MNTDNALVKLERATQMLAECRSPKDAKRIADLAAAAAEYARRAKLGEEAENYAKEIRIDALTTMGMLLAKTPKATGELKRGSHAPVIPRGNSGKPPLSLKSMGITLKESAQSQALARAKTERPELHQAVRNGEVSVKAAAKEMARPPVANTETREEREKRQAIHRFTNDLTFWVERIIHNVSTPQQLQRMLARVDRTATNEPNKDLWLTPDRIRTVGNGLAAFADLWELTPWNTQTKRKNYD